MWKKRFGVGKIHSTLSKCITITCVAPPVIVNTFGEPSAPIYPENEPIIYYRPDYREGRREKFPPGSAFLGAHIFENMTKFFLPAPHFDLSDFKQISTRPGNSLYGPGYSIKTFNKQKVKIGLRRSPSKLISAKGRVYF